MRWNYKVPLFGQPNTNNCDPAILRALDYQSTSSLPMMVLLGEQALVVPNATMSVLISAIAGRDMAGRSLLDLLPNCKNILKDVYSDVSKTAYEPVLLNFQGKTATSSYHLDFNTIKNAAGNVIGIQSIAIEVSHYLRRIHELMASEQRLRQALETSGMIGVWNLNICTNILTADANVAKTFGVCIEECLAGMDHNRLLQAIHPDDRFRVRETLTNSIKDKHPYYCRYRVHNSDGKIRWVIASGKPCFDKPSLSKSPDAGRLLGVIIDITDQVETARALEDSRFQFETLTETLPQIVWSCDAEGRHDYFSNRWSEFTGIQPEHIHEGTWKELVDPDHWPIVCQTWNDARTNGKPYDIEYRFRHHSGEYRWLRVMALPIRDNEGRITRWFGTSTDVHDSYIASAERVRFTQELERIASEDELTGTLTRRAFTERAKIAIQVASKTLTPIGLIMLDVDHFKQINDTFGHPGGDQVLAITAKRIRSVINQQDIMGRLGGDEFCIVLNKCPPENAVKVSERIRNCILGNLITLTDHRQVAISISLGVTGKIPEGDEFDELMLIADKALYHTKSLGRNQSSFLTIDGCDQPAD